MNKSIHDVVRCFYPGFDGALCFIDALAKGNVGHE
jgi:hypothetical protein